MEKNADEDRIRMSVAGTEALMIDNSRNVGIGTSTPSRLLDVAGNASFGVSGSNTKLRIFGSGSSLIELEGYGDALRLNSASSFRVVNAHVDATRYMVRNNGSTTSPSIYTSNEQSGFYFPSSGGTNEVGAVVNNTERLRIKANGNVGVGTSSPNNNLEVVSATPTVNIGLQKTGYKWMELTVGTNGTGAVFDNSSFFGIFTSSSRQNSNPTERMRVQANGNVGIGTTAPKAFLHIDNNNLSPKPRLVVGDYTVNGSGNSSSSLFTGNSWYEYPAIVGVGNAANTLDIPALSGWGSCGVVGVGGPSTGGRKNVGVYGHAYFDQNMGGNHSNYAYGGYFTSKITSNCTDNTGNLYGVYAMATSTEGAQVDGTVYGVYGRGIGETNNIVYGGYFSANGGSANYGLYSAAGLNYFSDKVGVGTSSPDEMLDVAGKAKVEQLQVTTGASAGKVLTSDANGNATWQAAPAGSSMSDADGDTKIQVEESADEDKIRFDTRGNEAMIIDNNGNVGIGTSSPTRSLQIQVNNNGQNFPLFIRNRNGSTGSNGVGIGFNSEQNGDWIKAGIFHERTAGYGVGKLHFLVDDATDNGSVTLSESRMTISNNGKVGIGTTNPSAQLHVNGDVRISDLAGSGTRMVVADANGDLTTQAIPSGGGGFGSGSTMNIYMTGDISNLDVSGVSILRIDLNNHDHDIKGLTGGVAGQVICVINIHQSKEVKFKKNTGIQQFRDDTDVNDREGVIIIFDGYHWYKLSEP